MAQYLRIQIFNFNWEKGRSNEDDIEVDYLKMKMNKIRSEKKTATLSIVLSMTKSWRRRLGMKRTSLKIRSKRKVRKTLSPEPELPSYPAVNDCPSSTILKQENLIFYFVFFPYLILHSMAL